MFIGKVVGTVVSTRRNSKFEGLKLLLVQRVDVDLTELGGCLLAVDVMGCGVGEYVLYATGSSARQTEETNKRPVDAVIMAIIDRWDVGGQLKYHKYFGSPEVTAP